jgi:hypothetical protein
MYTAGRNMNATTPTIPAKMMLAPFNARMVALPVLAVAPIRYRRLRPLPRVCTATVVPAKRS